MSWPIVKLGNVSEKVDYGLTTSAVDKVDGPRFLRITDMQDDSVNWKNVPSCECSPSEYENNRLDVGDIVFARTGATTGKSYLIRELKDPAVFASYLIRVRPSQDIDAVYLSHFFKSSRYWYQISAMSNGAAQPGVNSSKLKELEIPLPPLSEQKRIAIILDRADAIRRKQQQAIQLADDFLRALFLDMFGDPATNPKGWPVYKMSEVIEFKGGSQPPKETFEYEEKEGYIRLVQIRDFRTDKFKTYIPEKLARRRFEVDDVMIGRYGPPVFQILRGLSGSYNVALMKALPKGEVTKDFIYRLLQLPTYQDAVIANSERTAGQSGVNLDLLHSLDVPLPPISVQHEIFRKIQKAEILLDKIKLGLVDTEQFLSSLNQRAFSSGI